MLPRLRTRYPGKSDFAKRTHRVRPRIKVTKSISADKFFRVSASGSILTYLSHREISAIRMLKHQSTHTRFRVHHHALGELHPDLFWSQQPPEACLVFQVRACRITEAV
jgi:hypothetical protein